MAAKRKKSKKTAGKKRGRGAASIRPSKTQLKRDQKELQTDQKIADKYGVTRQAVQQWREQYEIPSLAEKKGPRNVKILKENDKGVDIDTIAEKYGLSKSQTYRIINQAGKSVKAGTKKKTTKKKSSAKKKAAPKKKTSKKKTTKKKSSSKKKAATKKKTTKKKSSSKKKAAPKKKTTKKKSSAKKKAAPKKKTTKKKSSSKKKAAPKKKSSKKRSSSRKKKR